VRAVPQTIEVAAWSASILRAASTAGDIVATLLGNTVTGYEIRKGATDVRLFQAGSDLQNLVVVAGDSSESTPEGFRFSPITISDEWKAWYELWASPIGAITSYSVLTQAGTKVVQPGPIAFAGKVPLSSSITPGHYLYCVMRFLDWTPANMTGHGALGNVNVAIEFAP